MARVPDPMQAPDPETRALYERLAARRGHIDGMYRALLNYPELCRQVSDLGSFLRFGSSALPADVRELVILWVARRLNAAYEWIKHVPPARQAGLPHETIEALRQGEEPSRLTPVQTQALAIARCVLERRSIPSLVQDALTARLGVKALVELVVLTGFYQMIAGVIFAFDVPLPDGEVQPFA